MFRVVGVADVVRVDAAQKCGEESWESERESVEVRFETV
jgi:hypothetical protein